MSYPAYVVCSRTYASFAMAPLGSPCPECEHAPMLHGEDGCGVCTVIYLAQKMERMLALGGTPGPRGPAGPMGPPGPVRFERASTSDRLKWYE